MLDTPSSTPEALRTVLRDFVLAPVVRAREANADGDRWLVEGALEAVEIEVAGIVHELKVGAHA